MATATPSQVVGDDATKRALTVMVRAMFPHRSFPDGPYERCAEVILAAAQDDLRFQTQLIQGLRDLDAVAGEAFGGLDAAKQLDVLRGISATEFFEGVRSRVITTLYDDHEVWALLGYEGPSFDHGGYAHRGYDDLDWLPTPKVA